LASRKLTVILRLGDQESQRPRGRSVTETAWERSVAAGLPVIEVIVLSSDAGATLLGSGLMFVGRRSVLFPPPAARTALVAVVMNYLAGPLWPADPARVTRS